MAPFYINGSTGISGVDGSAATPALQGTDTNTGISFGSDVIIASTGGTEKARLTASGQWLVGASTARNTFFNGTYAPVAQVESASANNPNGLSIGSNTNDDNPANIYLFKTRGTSVGANTAVQNGDVLGSIAFAGANGTDVSNTAAWIRCIVDGVPFSSGDTTDLPGALTFSTTADGASLPTEAMRIRATGNIEMGKADSTEKLAVLTAGQNNAGFSIFATNASYSSSGMYINVNRAANSAYSFYQGYSGDFADLEFRLRGDGNGTCDGAWTGGGADYAEYFEWSDSNLDEEDRRGISVVLDGDKIREAVAGEDPIGVISGNPSVVGDAAWNKWTGKYLRDEFGTYIQEDYEVEDEDGNTVVQQRRKLNPAYDPDAEYIPREQRPEWDCVGLMGKLRIRKGQVTGSRWIKMRDISATVEEWLVR